MRELDDMVVDMVPRVKRILKGLKSRFPELRVYWTMEEKARRGIQVMSVLGSLNYDDQRLLEDYLAVRRVQKLLSGIQKSERQVVSGDTGTECA